MEFSKEIIDGITVIKIDISEASLNHSEAFKKFLYDAIEDVASPKLVLDMAKIEYMDSSFIGSLVAGLKNVLSKSGEMGLINIQDDVMSLFELTRLDKVFKIYKGLEDAIEDLK